MKHAKQDQPLLKLQHRPALDEQRLKHGGKILIAEMPGYKSRVQISDNPATCDFSKEKRNFR